MMANVEPWGDFSDLHGWCGYVPLSSYFVAVFLQVVEDDMDFMRRSMQMLDAAILAGDASLKVVKVHLAPNVTLSPHMLASAPHC